MKKVQKYQQGGSIQRRLYENFTPFNYGKGSGRFFNAVLLNNKAEDRDTFLDDAEEIPKLREYAVQEKENVRNDAWAKFLGLPQETNMIQPSAYTPTKAKQKDAEYFDIADPDWKRMMVDFATDAAIVGWNDQVDPVVMGNFQFSSGEDKRGKYIAYYDKWDLKGLGNTVGKPFEIYGRVYEDEMYSSLVGNPSSTASPKIQREAIRMGSKIMFKNLHANVKKANRGLAEIRKTEAPKSKAMGGRIQKYQQGGPLDFNSMLSGLFPENDYDFDYDQTPVTAKSLYPDLEKKYLAQAPKFLGVTPIFDKAKAKKKARKEARKIANDPLYQQSVFDERRQETVADYFKSDYFQEGMQGIFAMQQDIQDQTDAERDPFEIDQYRVGPDQGFAQSFQKGGVVPKVSKDGYKTGSPDAEEKALLIKGNKITMKGVDKGLLLVPDSGDPVYAEPNSGDYYFPGATEVTEYPVESLQEGGTVQYFSHDDDLQKKVGEFLNKFQNQKEQPGEDKFFNPPPAFEVDYMKKLEGNIDPGFSAPPPVFMKNFGSTFVKDQGLKNAFSSMNRISLLGSVKSPKQWEEFIINNPGIMQMGGNIQEPVPVQLEKGEEIIFEDNSIIKPKAKKRHSQMDDHTYTDVLPSGTYIASRDKSQVLDRAHAENMIVSGMGPLEYDENGVVPIRKEKNFGEMFKKKRQTPADVARNIRSRIPTTDNEDLFGKQTNLLNLQTRTPYTNALIRMAEGKGRETSDAEHPDAMKYGGFAQMKDGGTLGYQPPKHIWPAIIGAVASIAGGAISGIGASKARKAIEQNKQESISDINKFEQDSNNRAGIGLGIGSASVLGQFASQDTSYNYLNLDPLRTRTQNAFTTAGQNIQLQDRLADQTQQAPLSTVSRQASYGDPRAGIQAYNAAYSSYLNRTNERKLGMVGMQTDLGLSEAEAMNKIDLPEIMDKQKGDMYTKTSDNLLSQGLFAGLGKEGQNFLSNRDRIQGATTSARMAARGHATSALNNIPFMYADSVERIGYGVAGIASAVQNQDTTGSINFQSKYADPNYQFNSGMDKYMGEYYQGKRYNHQTGKYE